MDAFYTKFSIITTAEFLISLPVFLVPHFLNTIGVLYYCIRSTSDRSDFHLMSYIFEGGHAPDLYDLRDLLL